MAHHLQSQDLAVSGLNRADCSAIRAMFFQGQIVCFKIPATWSLTGSVVNKSLNVQVWVPESTRAHLVPTPFDVVIHKSLLLGRGLLLA